ncbi:non-classical arabinogalactan protein 31-like isoform X2 [Tribolium madens]|uniref:non-classical arabinogalactan protein 31-like isoform X2 n=1 Tax=Tribolium madens TaxID=41895 RepID=UPI001CF76134|nr:non-classical arabinogalactan protein 31-like isoform X2 [Tribolium madens]XP_044266744.1 non-classical arabinogalactan protein 31-like isoform X2 [Tribolium madens]
MHDRMDKHSNIHYTVYHHIGIKPATKCDWDHTHTEYFTWKTHDIYLRSDVKPPMEIISTDMKPEVDMPSQKTGKQLNNPPEPPLQAPPKEPSQAPPQSPSQAPPEAPPKAPLKGPPKAQGTKPNHGLELDR